MPSRSKLSYSEAIKILGRQDDRINKLDRALGGALLAAAPFTGGASLALLDPKSELIAWIRQLSGAAPGRIKSSTGKSHYELLEAAHSVMTLSAFFDGMQEVLGDRYDALELTDAEKIERAGHEDGESVDLVEFRIGTISMPSSVRGFTENLVEVKAGLERICDSTLIFAQGLRAWDEMTRGLDLVDLRKTVVERSLDRYKDRFVRLASDIPEFNFWIGANEHHSSRSLIREVGSKLDRVQADAQGAFSDLRNLLMLISGSVNPITDIERKLGRVASDALKRHLWRAEKAPLGLTFPTVDEGFVSPDFKLAVSEEGARPSEYRWWQRYSERKDLATFLAHYIADPESTRSPLVILGHPGAGKTLLAEVLAARLPSNLFTPILVRLRRVDADADLHQQIESAVEATARESVAWGRMCRESSTTKVVILDGLDELIQATGVAQSGYIEKVVRFQQEEWADGYPVVPIITSRTLVMDRVRVPEGTVLIQLQEFTDRHVESWTKSWNRANLNNPSFQALTPAQFLKHDELARQPLLITLLAIYLVDASVAGATDETLSRAELYKRLLDAFISRQVRDKSPTELGAAEQEHREAVLRRDLAVAAFAMFNRGQQFVTEHDIERDLTALSPEEGDVRRAEFGEPVTRAGQTVAAFFFIHIAQADEHEASRARRSYEFLHATFGEYLVAEYALMILREIGNDWTKLQQRLFSSNVDDQLLRALLAHQPLFKRQPVVEFLQDLIGRLGAERIVLRNAAVDLLCAARDRRGFEQVKAYDPTSFDSVRRAAAYTSNLATLAIIASEDGLRISDLPSAAKWRSAVYLWRSGLDEEGQVSVISHLERDDNDVVRVELSRTRHLEQNTARLAGDYAAEATVAAGIAISRGIPGAVKANQVQLHSSIAALIGRRWVVPSLSQMTLWDVRAYEQVRTELLNGSVNLLAPSSTLLLDSLLQDSQWVPAAIVDDLIRASLKALNDIPSRIILAGLITKIPELLDRVPEILQEITTESPLDALHWQILVTTAAGLSDLDKRNAIEEAADKIFKKIVPEDINGGTVNRDMFRAFGDATEIRPGIAMALVRSMNEFGNLGWQQVTIGDLSRFLKKVDGSEAAKCCEPLRKLLSSKDPSVEGMTNEMVLEFIHEVANRTPLIGVVD